MRAIRQLRFLGATLIGCFLLWGCDGEGSSSSEDKPEDISASDAQDVESAPIPDIVDVLGSAADANPLDTFVEEDAGDWIEDSGISWADIDDPSPGLGLDYSSTDPGATPRYDLDGGDWMSVGWPNDLYRDKNSNLDLSVLPNPNIDLLVSYFSVGEETLDGYGLNGSVYFQFDLALDESMMPQAADTLSPTASVQLVNTEVGSSRYGEFSPLEFRYYSQGTDLYYEPKTLAMKPLFGRPLAEGERYCAVITRALKDSKGRYLQQAPGFAAALASNHPSLEALEAWLPDSPLRREDIAVAACFTTQRASAEMRQIEDFLKGADLASVKEVHEPRLINEFHGLYGAPNFQAGEKPYNEEGDLKYSATGTPEVQSMEDLRYMMLIPRFKSMPEGGWPIVIYAHGTGGSYESCRGTARTLNQEGLAVICFDQPLHGPRGPDPEKPLSDSELVTFSFNFLNPRAGRWGFRQAAIDILTLSQMLESGAFDLEASQTLSGEPVNLNPDKIYLFGHSHGALSGAIALGVDPRIKGAVISGGGGVIVNTILLRKDPFDVSQLLRLLLGIDTKYLDRFHPMLTVVQMLVDATDPVNYAPYWLNPVEGGTPKHIFITEGTADHATPGVATDAMAAAAGVPLISPIAKGVAAHSLQGLEAMEMELKGNIKGMTAGLKQWQDEDHFVAFEYGEPRSIWKEFFISLVEEGTPSLRVGAGFATAYPMVEGSSDCESASWIDLDDQPLRLVGNTSLASDDFSTQGCGEDGRGAGHRDRVYAFSVSTSGTYAFKLETPPLEDEDAAPVGPDLFYLLSSCAPESASCFASKSSGSIRAELSAGTSVYLVVDGSSPERVGPFSLEVSLDCAEKSCADRECGDFGCGNCGECSEDSVCTEDGKCVLKGAGDRCSMAIPVDSLPFSFSGSSEGLGADHYFSGGKCPGYSYGYGKASSDLVFSFTAPETGTYNFDHHSTFDAALYVVEDCLDINSSCLGASRTNGGERVQLILEAGSAVFVIADGAGNSTNIGGDFSLSIEACVPQCDEKVCGGDGCGGLCGTCETGFRCVEEDGCTPIKYVCAPTATCESIPQGDTCESPILVEEASFEYSGESTDFFDDYRYAANQCPGMKKAWGQEAPDMAFWFSPGEAGDYHVRLDADFDANLYATSDCGDIASFCLAVDQDENKDGGESLLLSLDSEQGVYVIVDGASEEEDSGTYAVEFEPCVPNCEGRACGSDGCTGSCGSCSSQEVCSGYQCKAKPGFSCEATRNFSKLPYKHSSSTSGFSDSQSPVCTSDSVGGKDVSYRFKAQDAGTFRFALSASFEAHLEIRDTCSMDSANCLLSAQGEDLEIDLDMEDGDVVYLVVDGAAEGESGSYTLNVSQLCFPECEGKVCGDDGCGGVCGICAPPQDICTEDGLCLEPLSITGNSCAQPRSLPGNLDFYEAEGDSATAENHYAFADGHCPGFVGKGGASRDEAWFLESEAGGSYLIELIPEGFDGTLYAVWDCAAVSETCFLSADETESESLLLSLSPGEGVFIIVDGASNRIDESGPYRLRLQRF